jgi:hypothetical protein
VALGSLPCEALGRKAMQVTGLIWMTAKGERMTLHELSAFVAEAREAGVPEDASPYVGTSWRGGIRRIAVSRPLPERSSG